MTQALYAHMNKKKFPVEMFVAIERVSHLPIMKSRPLNHQSVLRQLAESQRKWDNWKFSDL
jgi:hypothetical protein